MKKTHLFLICGLAFCYLQVLYILSLRIDAFPWGNSQTDSLYLLAIFYLVPLILLSSILKWLAIRKTPLENQLQGYCLYYAISTVLIAFITPFDAQWLHWISFLLSLIAMWLLVKDGRMVYMASEMKKDKQGKNGR